MYREMRRKDRKMSEADAQKVLAKCEYGMLATSDAQNNPYVVPMSYAYADNCIYLHSAKAGQKLDNIIANPKVSFCVVGDTKVIPEEFATEYESVILFGTAEIIEDKQEKFKGLMALVDKYSPGFKMQGADYANKDMSLTRVIKINIEHITGKQKSE
jgi:nitroimidazol reductase NimA-like FMN-containing flavoprotein (pyridoxamine 5'-phosphate oxidase superfamily)